MNLYSVYNTFPNVIICHYINILNKTTVYYAMANCVNRTMYIKYYFQFVYIMPIKNYLILYYNSEILNQVIRTNKQNTDNFNEAQIILHCIFYYLQKLIRIISTRFVYSAEEVSFMSDITTFFKIIWLLPISQSSVWFTMFYLKYILIPFYFFFILYNSAKPYNINYIS